MCPTYAYTYLTILTKENETEREASPITNPLYQAKRPKKHTHTHTNCLRQMSSFTFGNFVVFLLLGMWKRLFFLCFTLLNMPSWCRWSLLILYGGYLTFHYNWPICIAYAYTYNTKWQLKIKLCCWFFCFFCMTFSLIRMANIPFRSSQIAMQINEPSFLFTFSLYFSFHLGVIVMAAAISNEKFRIISRHITRKWEFFFRRCASCNLQNDSNDREKNTLRIFFFHF